MADNRGGPTRAGLAFEQAPRPMLDVAGFSSVTVEGPCTRRPAARDDGRVVFVAKA